MSDTETASDLMSLTADVVASFVSSNSLPSSELPKLIADVHQAFARVANPVQEPAASPLKPPMPVKKSITDEYLISFEDGKPYKSLKRHLATRGLTPQDYRAKWGLPKDYPMVAPGYAARRSELARTMGLGRKAKPAPEPAPTPAPVKKTRGRKKAA